MRLVLFTASYPYVTGAEQNFLETELQYLADEFDEIIIVPQTLPQTELKTRLSSKIRIENDFAQTLAKRGKVHLFLLGLLSFTTYFEIFKMFKVAMKPSYLKRLIFFSGLANLTNQWIAKWIRDKKSGLHQYLFYTYWFDFITTGAAIAKRRLIDIKIISRAHGYDIYEERNTPPYWPCRSFTLNHLEYLFPDSDAGTKYLHQKYPDFKSRIQTAYLGVPDYRINSKPSIDGAFRIVSCSRMVPVKRLKLLLEGILFAAQKMPNQKFIWFHFGEGELRGTLEMQTKKLPPNVEIQFPGYTTQSELFDYYRKNPVDVFMNVSQSEGTSVAIMEAISCGIPIIATAVGGNKEIVTEQNGILLPENPTPEEVAEIIISAINNLHEKRQGSRQVWNSKYNAHVNFANFAKLLAKICLS